jgi:hypothetical protein
MTRAARPQARTNKAPYDTVVGCRIRAEADLLASVTMFTANERVRMERSAASWSARAELLERQDDNLMARKAAATGDPPTATADFGI